MSFVQLQALSRMSNRHPNFLVVGAQKCGTSYLCAVLAKHPSVFHTDPKEPLFFQRGDVNPENFDQYLAKFFSAAGDRPLLGEGSTVYFQWPNALENIQAYLGDELKLFICLRQPTDRAVSFYLHNLRKGRIDGSERICDIGHDVRMSPVLSSIYAPHLERWINAYGDRVKVLLFDELLESPTAFIRQSTDFLGIEPMGQVRTKAVNKGFGLVWRNDRLTLEVADPAVTPPSFAMSELEDLHALFQDDIHATEALLGITLDDWKKMPAFTAKQTGW
jgi:hypothetical protein